jgi:hypothetical protein
VFGPDEGQSLQLFPASQSHAGFLPENILQIFRTIKKNAKLIIIITKKISIIT